MTRFSRMENRWHQYWFARKDFTLVIRIQIQATEYFNNHKAMKEMYS